MEIPILELKCDRCGHTWVPIKKEIYICPSCKVPLEKIRPKIYLHGDIEKFLENHEVVKKD